MFVTQCAAGKLVIFNSKSPPAGVAQDPAGRRLTLGFSSSEEHVWTGTPWYSTCLEQQRTM